MIGQFVLVRTYSAGVHVGDEEVANEGLLRRRIEERELFLS